MLLANLHKPDLALMDLLMPLGNGIEAATTTAIRSVLPKTCVMVVTMFPELVKHSMAKLAGIHCVIDKANCTTELARAIQTFYGESEPPAIAPP